MALTCKNHYCFHLSKKGNYSEEMYRYLYKDDYTLYVNSCRRNNDIAELHIINPNGLTGEEKEVIFQVPEKNILEIMEVYTMKPISIQNL